jgi:uncharacterized protein YciI
VSETGRRTAQTERAFVVEATLAPDAGIRREPVRPAHLARLRTLLAGGQVVAVGALEDLSASILIVRAEDEAAARALIAADVYVASGVWTRISIRPIQLVRP